MKHQWHWYLSRIDNLRLINYWNSKKEITDEEKECEYSEESAINRNYHAALVWQDK